MGAFSNIGQKFQLRSAQSFFDTRAFKPPRDLGETSNRLGENIDYFQANYSIIVAMAILYVCYHNHKVAFAFACIFGAGYWLFNVRRNPLALSGRVFSENELMIGFVIGSLAVLQYVGERFLTYSLAFAGLLILTHAAMLKTSFGAKATNAANDVAGKFQ